MGFLIAALHRLFLLQDFVYRLFGIYDRTPVEPPCVCPSAAAGDAGYSWLSSRLGLRIFYRSWLLPEGVRTLGRVICLHGVGAHGRHFHVIGRRLAPDGFEVYAPDLPGHGLSDGRRGDFTELDLTLNALDDFVDRIGRPENGLPVFMLAESFGALLALRYATMHQQKLTGIVLSGPELEPTAEARGGILQILREYGPIFRHVIIDSRRRVIDISGREELVSRDKAEVEETKRDPLRNNKLSPRTITAVYELVFAAMETASRVKVPTLILQGGNDMVTDPQAAYKLCNELETPDKEVAYFPDAYHGLFFDPDTPLVLDRVEGWLRSHSRGIEK